MGFDNEKYIRIQSENIRKRIDKFGGKLYLEFGGKLFDDFHASRVLPGFSPDSKIKMLMELKDSLEAIVVVNAGDIAKNKMRGDNGITYDMEALRLVDSFRERGILADSIVLTQYVSQPAVVVFEKRLKALNIKVYRHNSIEGYPLDVEKIVSEKGFGKNDYIRTSRPLVVVTAPGPGSGKMATCLSQLYHENKKGVSAGYAKFETFPIWNLPLKHPINVAYEAATIDIVDVNMIDPYHLEVYSKQAVNYNRDIEIFPVLNSILKSISGESPYKSPTDMGVNMAGFCITDEEVVSAASRLEVIRRYYDLLKDRKQGMASDEMVARMELLMKNASIGSGERKVIGVVMKRAETLNKDPSVLEATAVSGVELEDGTILTGRTSMLLGASSAMILNALKTMAGMDDSVLLISPTVLEPIQALKTENLGFKNTKLHVDEMLIALSISALTDTRAKVALEQLPKLRGCEMHSSVILSSVEESTLKRLGLNITCEPVYQNNALFQGQRKI
ncbi:MAG: DUF1846 domain-containing protein [Candidatus Methanoplasma sp.]|nr:DUF1846 domain-containing protein [Candidatus Methanoplasma termitum]MCL2333238.1 DUF1846 domain-containing protein [Candidatus Methanoplasma sp.]